MDSRFFVGVMTGTSVDGLDLAILEDAYPPVVRTGVTYPLPESLRQQLLTLVHNRAEANIDALGYADAELGDFIGRCVLRLLQDEGLDPVEVSAIGSHGQTVRHRPDGRFPFTLQIGDPHRIAEITGITTVGDFRRRDVAAGGQGAPLVPAFHRALFAVPHERRVVLNIGGIANVTGLLPNENLVGFDTGPGNGLLDLWTEEHLGVAMDKDGEWAATGVVNPDLLSAGLADPYFSRAAPKSTGREYFNREWLEQLIARRQQPLPAADVQRTLVELVCRSIADAVRQAFGVVSRLIVCGGGRRNTLLLNRLRQISTCPVDTSEDWKVDGDSLEAAAFAWFAARALAGEPAGVPGVTGARGARILGVVYPR
ncbi:MAG: anhydro-N-acetylmuramic acid kinase [Gammaproteobacteria bacterium]|nr:anhydro-N-acetylmuramic acid kinase [Gammaproteobacteria bacterium]